MVEEFSNVNKSSVAPGCLPWARAVNELHFDARLMLTGEFYRLPAIASRRFPAVDLR